MKLESRILNATREKIFYIHFQEIFRFSLKWIKAFQYFALFSVINLFNISMPIWKLFPRKRKYAKANDF